MKLISLLIGFKKTLVMFRFNLEIVEISLLVSRMLFEEDEAWIRVPHLLQEPSQHTSVLEIHPMAAILPHLRILIRKPSIFFPQLLHRLNISPREVVSIVGAVICSHLNRKGSVPEVIELDAVGVPGHHGCACDPIREHGAQVVDSVSSCRVPSDEHFVWVHDPIEYKPSDDNVEELREILFKPHIPGLFTGTRY